MKIFLGIVLVCASLVWLGARIVVGVQFDIACGGHIERAAHANRVELAKQEMEVTMKYIEDRKMTSGYTSVLYNTPDEDVGFWHDNLKTSLDELNGLSPQASNLEKSNVLLKLHETLTQSGDQGKQSVRVPDGISVFPNNLAWAMWGWFSLLLFIAGMGFLIAWLVEVDFFP